MHKHRLFTLVFLFVFASLSTTAQTFDGSTELVAIKAAPAANYWTWATSDTMHRGSFYGAITLRLNLENGPEYSTDPRLTTVKVYSSHTETWPKTLRVCRDWYCTIYQEPIPASFTMSTSGTGPTTFFARAIASWQTMPTCSSCNSGNVSIQTTTPVYANNTYSTMPVAPPPTTSTY